MRITLKDKMKELSPAQRKKVEARAAELIAYGPDNVISRHDAKESQRGQTGGGALFGGDIPERRLLMVGHGSGRCGSDGAARAPA